jgi:acyl transferase domain-containing protein/3-hydroxymyristoyl/3-hydroxydecanoyl-(acyl carrier protein) dehydratase/1-acyl-sn-glycerol-3-phosphate acyltransferase
MTFSPIAIVGWSCNLPGAGSPAALWDVVVSQRSAVRPVPAGRWRLNREDAVTPSTSDATDRTWSDAGGYVEGFAFDPIGLRLEPGVTDGLDPLFLWTLAGVRDALASSGEASGERTGLVMGNLSFPSAGMSRFAESVWLGKQASDLRRRLGFGNENPRNRFMSGLPARLAAEANGLELGGVAVDAACASALYAIKLACDRLQHGEADRMVAGATNCADDLFIHVGFCALSAMSKSGRSRPFHREADGLVPAEGAVYFVLERLEDALANGRRVLGVIRGVGLSNDGRGRGLLAPSSEGQVRALQSAYAQSGWSPRDVGLVECHATGTTVGDATELESMRAVFGDQAGLPIGSLKSNLGHLVTAAGGAALIKVLSAMQHEMLPPSMPVDKPISALAGAGFRLLQHAERWTGPRRAAVSAFGFGGNNAHLLVEAPGLTSPVSVARPAGGRLAVISVEAKVGAGESTSDLESALVDGVPVAGVRRTIDTALEGLRFPPKDLEATLGQQRLVFEAARDACGGLGLPRDRTAVLIGMGCDPEVARYGFRWRLADWGRQLGVDAAWVASAREAAQPRLQAPGVLGTMPNIVANRINAQLDLAGPSFSVSSEETSGASALEIARRWLDAGEVDAAVVGAVDLASDAVHAEAIRGVGLDRNGTDAAAVLVIVREADLNGRTPMALLEPIGGRGDALDASTLAAVVGRPHAAEGLVAVTSAIVAARAGVSLRPGRPATPLGGRPVDVDSGERQYRVHADPVGVWRGAVPRLHRFAADDDAALVAAVRAGRVGGVGGVRLAIVADDRQLPTRRDAAVRWLTAGGARPEGVFRGQGHPGQVALVFGGAAAAYPGMGASLLRAMPELVAPFVDDADVARAVAWVYADGGAPTHPLEVLWGQSLLAQAHARLLQGVLSVRPDAVIGYSSGESNALFAIGAWTDFAAMVRDCTASSVFRDQLVGDYAALAASWKHPVSTWRTVLVRSTPEAVDAALPPEVRRLATQAPDEVLVGGEAAGIAVLLERLGEPQAVHLGYDVAVHMPEVARVGNDWWNLHHRPTNPVDVRVFSNGARAPYLPTAAAAADAITAQAIAPMDWPATILRAHHDGVRVFIECGPRAAMTSTIRRILGDRPHTAVALDARDGVAGAFEVAGALWALGVAVDPDALSRRLERLLPAPRPARPGLSLPAHLPEVRLPTFAEAPQVLPRAPYLPPISADGGEPARTSAVAPKPALAVVIASAAPPAATPSASPASLGFAAHISAVHQQFLADQAAVHQAYLAMAQRTQQTLLSAYGGRGVPAAVPGVPVAAVALAAPPPTLSPPPRASMAPPAAAVALPTAPPKPSVAPPPAIAPVASSAAALPGPKIDRRGLEVLASGRISDVFGPQFAYQDGYHRQVRMPEPPLLLADRVLGIGGEPLSMKTGTIWTETDVKRDSWWLNDGRMPAGVHIESGQADLLMISWLGVDQFNKSERVYRLLGCELTWHRSLPALGETLCYDIHVDGHAKHGDVRLFFFHYDCRINGELALTVRQGQAGFFTEAELAESGGILWDAETGDHDASARLDPPAIRCDKSSFSTEDIRRFSEGDAFGCFGDGFQYTQPHVRTPKIQSGRMLFLRTITDCDPNGGPWKRGYLRAEWPLSASDWFFEGHFKNDPCMPGTLMFEGCVQAMSFYLAFLGHTAPRDGWRFEPVPGVPYQLRCRGQVTPQSQLLTYEIFVEEVHDGPIPTLFADVLCTVDGLKAFHARRIGLRLVPDWPLEVWAGEAARAEQLTGAPVPLKSLGGTVGWREAKPVASHDGFPFDYASLLACAWGRPSKAFGPMYAPFDGTRKVARLPGPPYHFMTRVTVADAPFMQIGGVAEVEYDIPAECWYFEQNGHPTMPFCVLMEAALQPCGWLASFVGSALTTETDLMFRNLDGTGNLLVDILPGSGTLRTRTKITNISKSAGMIIESFDVRCWLNDVEVFEMKTVFGFFPKEAFENQVGLAYTPEEKARMDAPDTARIDLNSRPMKYFGTPQLAEPMLLMIDRVTTNEPTGGKRGLGYYRAEKQVDPAEWFFKAHFWQDPVQPGSLGIEALVQLLQVAMLERGLHEKVKNPRFEPIMLGKPITWKYRGQVVPKNKKIGSEIEITAIGEDEHGVFALCDGYLWVDGKRIYAAKDLGMRIRGDGVSRAREETIDSASESWIKDHCPTWTIPALPMASMVDRLLGVAAARGGYPATLTDVQVHRWLPVTTPTRVQTRVAEDTVSFEAWRDASDAALSRYEPVCSGKISATPAIDPPVELVGGVAQPEPYWSGVLFHGPTFHGLTRWVLGDNGAEGDVDLGRVRVPPGRVGQGLLDVATHVIPHDNLRRWSDRIPAEVAGYPYRMKSVTVFGALPTAGVVRVEARFIGFDGDDRYPMTDVWVRREGEVVAFFRLVEVLVPKGRVGTASPDDRRAFLGGRFVPGVGLSSVVALTDGRYQAELSAAELKASDWLPGTVASLYGETSLVAIATKDVVAQRAWVHPSTVSVTDGAGFAAVRPLRRHPVRVESTQPARVVEAGAPVFDLAPIQGWWRSHFNIGPWAMEDVYYALIRRFVGDVIVTDPAAFRAISGRPCLYVGNHQVGVESLLFSVILSGLSGVPTVTVAKAEHRTTWLGTLIQHGVCYPGVVDPGVILFFNRDDKESLVEIIQQLAVDLRSGAKSAMVHVEGTRSLAARAPVQKMSGAFLDMAVSVGAPIVPVRFVGGLPVDPLEKRIEFPVGMGRQDYWVGRPILPEELTGLPYRERKELVLAAMNALGPADEVPGHADSAFAAGVDRWVAESGATHEDATVLAALADYPEVIPELRAILDARSGGYAAADGPKGAWLAALAQRLLGARFAG